MKPKHAGGKRADIHFYVYRSGREVTEARKSAQSHHTGTARSHHTPHTTTPHTTHHTPHTTQYTAHSGTKTVTPGSSHGAIRHGAQDARESSTKWHQTWPYPGLNRSSIWIPLHGERGDKVGGGGDPRSQEHATRDEGVAAVQLGIGPIARLLIVCIYVGWWCLGGEGQRDRGWA